MFVVHAEMVHRIPAARIVHTLALVEKGRDIIDSRRWRRLIRGDGLHFLKIIYTKVIGMALSDNPRALSL